MNVMKKKKQSICGSPNIILNETLTSIPFVTKSVKMIIQNIFYLIFLEKKLANFCSHFSTPEKKKQEEN